MRRVMVFGVFDGLHEGHRAFLDAAREEGDYLVVALAQDHIVHALKDHPPKRTFDIRSAELLHEALADEVVPGDDELGSYDVIRAHHPHVIALGYDQEYLRKDIEERRGDFRWELDVIIMEPHKPETLHSSLLEP